MRERPHIMLVIIHQYGVGVIDREDFERFSVRSFVDVATAAQLLLRIGAGRLDPDGHVAIACDFIVKASRPQSQKETWVERFAAMIDFASARGWMTSDGAVRGHVDWSREPAAG